MLEIKKKWSDVKLEIKKRVVAHRKSVAATGGGSLALTPHEERAAAIIGEELIAGVLPTCEGDSTIHPGKYEIHHDSDTFYDQLQKTQISVQITHKKQSEPTSQHLHGRR